MAELHDVELTEFMFPCVTYVLRRAGINMTPEKFVATAWNYRPFDESVAQTGEIVCWRNGGVETDVTLRICDGTPVTRRVLSDYHYGIYEGNGLISDLTIDGDNYAPRVRVMDCNKSRKPDFILSA